MRVEIDTNAKLAFTHGFDDWNALELEAEVSRTDLLPYAVQLLETLCNGAVKANIRITEGATFQYGYWPVTFKPAPTGRLEAWEPDPLGGRQVRGCNSTLMFRNMQKWMCSEHNAQFAPPKHAQLAVISEGVMEGLPVEGVRYPSPEHMSGWWFTTSLYNGNIDSLKVVHLYHVTGRRADLVKYLALPYKFRFFSGNRQVWEDPEIDAPEKLPAK